MATQTGSYDFMAAKAVQTNLDNMEVGGRNLLRFTSNPSCSGAYTTFSSGTEPTGWYSYQTNNNVTCVRTDDGIKITSNQNAANGLVVPLCSEGAIESGQEYTLRFTYRCEGTFYERAVYLLGRSGNVYTNFSASDFDMTGQWAEFVHTFKWTVASGNKAYALLIPYFRYFWFEMKDGSLKLEKGNVSTDWTPAPEDLSKEALALSEPNLAPFFSMPPGDGSYWFATTNLKTYCTTLDNGWARVSTTSLNLNVSPLKATCIDVVEPSSDYTVLLEVRNSTVAGSVKLSIYTANNSMWDASAEIAVTGDGEYRLKSKTKADLTAAAITHLRVFLNASGTGGSFAGDVRISLYKGEYNGPYKPYVGNLLYASQTDVAEAAAVAGNYIWESALNDMWLHSEDHGPDTDPNSETYGQATADTYGWRIGSVFELVRAGLSYMMLWVESSVTKLRLGLATAGHAILSPDGMEVFAGTNGADSVAKFGSTTRVGTSSGKHIGIDSSSGVAVMDGSDEVAGFGSTLHIGKVANDSRYFAIDSNGNGTFHGSKLDIFDYPYDAGTELSKGTIRHHYVKVANNDNNQSLHAVSLYASASDTRVGLYDETNSKWILQSMFQDPDVNVLVTIPQSFAIGKRMYLPNGTEIWDNAQGVTHLLTPTVSNKKAEFTFEPDGKIYRRTSTNGGTSWTSWTSIAG
jgi:hypothetical protein